MKIGIIREGKTPPDSRVTLTPSHCLKLQKSGIDICVQESPIRCFSDQEYIDAGIEVVESVDCCDVLIGVKEVPIPNLVASKTYFFFSHTIKEQPYNKILLQEILKKNIRLIDYEVLTNLKKKRLIAFGYFAGMVGAYNSVLGYGLKTKKYKLERLSKFIDYNASKKQFQNLNFPSFRIILTGTGRVGSGAQKVLLDMGIKQVSPEDYLTNEYNFAVFTQVDAEDYLERIDGISFIRKDFHKNPKSFKSDFKKYTTCSDIMINGIYWDNNAPAFFTKEDMKEKEFAIKLIADITCDIAPISSIPCTLRATKIADPFYGYNPITEKEVSPFQAGCVDMMTIDNLPSELPRDASISFGGQFVENIIEPLKDGFNHPIIKGATVTENGKLGSHFQYLENYIKD